MSLDTMIFFQLFLSHLMGGSVLGVIVGRLTSAASRI
jgi:hypothetical protein